MYHFTLRHIPGKTFSADGLSHRDPQPGDQTFPVNEDWFDEPDRPLKFEYPDLENGVPGAEHHLPLRFDDLKDKIDTHGSYYNQPTT